MTCWAPHCTRESIERFHREDPMGEDLRLYLSEMSVAIEDGRVVGMTALGGDHLHDIHVYPPEWGRGIGSVLMEHAERAGARRLAVAAFNTGAIRFYERRGWRRARTFEGEEMGTPMKTFEYRLDAAPGALPDQVGST